MSVEYGDGTIFAQYKNECSLGKGIHLDPIYDLPNVIWLGFASLQCHPGFWRLRQLDFFECRLIFIWTL